MNNNKYKIFNNGEDNNSMMSYSSISPRYKMNDFVSNNLIEIDVKIIKLKDIIEGIVDEN